MDPEYDDPVDDDIDAEYAECFDEDEEEAKPEPMSFPDAYAAANHRPVELVAPGLPTAFSSIEGAKESRFPARRVSHSAIALAEALKAAARIQSRP
jgi:hypothetical protein